MWSILIRGHTSEKHVHEGRSTGWKSMAYNVKEGVLHHCHPFSMRSEMARWQYQGDTLRSTLASVSCQECACDECWCVVALLTNMFNEGGSTGWKHGMWCEGVLHVMKDSSVTPSIFDEAWNGSLTIPRGHPEKHIGIRLVSGMRMWWMLMRCCTFEQHVHEGRRIGCKYGMWCEGALHVMKDSSVTPSIFDEVWNGSLTIPRGHPEKHIGIHLVSGMRMWWMLMRCCTFEQHVHEGRRIKMRCCTFEQHVHEGRRIGCKYGMWCEGALHVMKDSSVTPSIFDEAWNGSLTIPRGHPEKHIGIRLVSGMRMWWMLMRCCTFEQHVHEGRRIGCKHGMWCEGALHVMKDLSVTPSIFDEAWNGSLTIPRGHPEKHIGIRLVSGMRMWWMLMRCCTLEKHVHEGRRIGCKYGMWCEGALHVMKDSSVTPSIFDEAWNGSLTIPRGHPEKHIGIRLVSGMRMWWMLMRCCTFEKRVVLSGGSVVCDVKVCFMWWRTQVSRHPFSMRSEMARWQYQGHTLRSTLAFVWCQEWWMLMRCCTFWTACSWGSSYRVQAWYVMWRCASCDEGLKCHAIHFRWGLKWLVDNTKGTPWEAHWHSFGVRNAHVMNVDALLHSWKACSWGLLYRVQAWYVMWRCASCDEGLKCHAIHFRWGLKWLVDNTKGTPWEAHWHSFGDNAHVMNVDAVLQFWLACSWGPFYRVEAWYVMWRCASCDEGFKCHAIHFRWGLKWLDDNTKGTPWEAHWDSFGVRNAQVMHVDALLHSWKAGGSTGWKRGMWCEGVLHVMKDSSVTPSIFDEVWNGSLTIPRGHPEKHIGIRLASGMPKWWMLMRCCTFEKRVVLPGGSEVCGVKVCFMWWRTQVSRHPFSMRPEMARWQYQGDTLRSTLAFVWCQECQSDECWCVVALLKSGCFYWVEAWYVMWRCASCDEGLKCHAIHFRWGLKWLVDNTKGTPWEAHWHSFGVRNAHVMNVDAVLQFWLACSWGPF